jgi:hypothetical protein
MKLNAAVTFSLPAGSAAYSKFILWFYGAILDAYRGDIVALGDELCSHRRYPGSDSCV